MSLFKNAIMDNFKNVIKELDSLPVEEKVDVLNEMKKELHNKSPFSNEPVDCVLWVKEECIQGNDYNPNKVAPPEMKLLVHSITKDGYTQPIVSFAEKNETLIIVDGAHRGRVGKENKEIKKRLHGYLPVTIINEHRGELKDRVAATIRHNRARGVHGVIPMVDIVALLIKQGWPDDRVAKELGMDADEILRFKQNSGLPELFKDTDYSKTWE